MARAHLLHEGMLEEVPLELLHIQFELVGRPDEIPTRVGVGSRTASPPFPKVSQRRRSCCRFGYRFTRSRYARIRPAFAPTSLLPTRETERTSMRLP